MLIGKFGGHYGLNMKCLTQTDVLRAGFPNVTMAEMGPREMIG